MGWLTVILMVLSIVFLIIAVPMLLTQLNESRTDKLYAQASLVDAQTRNTTAVLSTMMPYFTMGLMFLGGLLAVVAIFAFAVWTLGMMFAIRRERDQPVYLPAPGVTRKQYIEQATILGYEVPHPNDMVVIPQGERR